MIKISERRKGIMLMILSALSFAIMASLVKSLAIYPVTEKLFFRNFFSLLITAILILKKGQGFIGKNKKLLLLRSVLGMLGIVFYFYAISHMKFLADATIMNNMSPFFVVILSFLFLKEDISKYQVIALILAILGVGLIVRPKFDLTIVPALSGLFSALFAGGAYVTVRYLRKTDSPSTIVFYFTLLTTVCMLPFILKGDWLLPTGLDIVKVLGVGVFATIGQYSMTYAYKFVEASQVSIYTYTGIIFSSIIGILVFKEALEIYTVLGGILIIAGGYINFHYKKLQSLEN